MFSFFHSKTYHDINPVSLIINAEYYVIIKEKLLDMYVYDAKIFLFFMKQFKKTWY